MNDNNNFFQAYSKLKSELINVIDNSPTETSAAKQSSTLIAPAFPIELVKEIVREYEFEQKKKEEEGNNLAIELTYDKFQSWLSTLKKQYHDQIKKLNFELQPSDPIFCEIDAFSHIEWGLKEVPHTKMLAFFLDPKKAHGLKKLPIGFFLAAASLTESEIGIYAENYREIDVHAIDAELWIPIKGKKDRRIDILIQLQKPECRILIEGKINANQGEYQLPDYKEWLKPKDNDALIYLTPKEIEKEELENGWKSLTWKDVALAFCALVNYCEANKTIKETISHDGFELLRLWTSTILHHVCEVPFISCRREDTLLNLVAHASHLMKVKEILENYRGE